jgi:hypothetical protein
MGQILGVNASSITNIAGVQVASISYVGPITAAAIGLGGGELVFTVDYWEQPSDACTNGAASILESGSQTLYYNPSNNCLYTDPAFENQFKGGFLWWWCQTQNISYYVNKEGFVKNTSVCQVVTGFLFTVQTWDEPLDACTNGATSISDKGSQTLYENEGIFYTDSSFQDRFEGQGGWYWCQTNNISYAIGGKGVVKDSSACSVVTGLVFTVYGIQGEEGFFESCVDGQNSINKNGSQILYQNGEMFYVDAEYTTPFNGMDTWWWCQTNNTSYRIGMEGNTMNINPCG